MKVYRFTCDAIHNTTKIETTLCFNINCNSATAAEAQGIALVEQMDFEVGLPTVELVDYKPSKSVSYSRSKHNRYKSDNYTFKEFAHDTHRTDVPSVD